MEFPKLFKLLTLMILAKKKELYEKILEEHNIFNSSDYKLLIRNYFKSLFVSFATNSFVFKFFSSLVIKFGYINDIKLINNFSRNDPNPFLLNKLPDSYKTKITNTQSAKFLIKYHYPWI